MVGWSQDRLIIPLLCNLKEAVAIKLEMTMYLHWVALFDTRWATVEIKAKNMTLAYESFESSLGNASYGGDLRGELKQL